MEYKLLETIKEPEDIKSFTDEELDELASEIRSELVETVSKTGGHLASNLGVVELTIAMHRSFESPKDAFVWDVGHQVYTHKLLTGRYEQFSSLRQNGGISGFPNPEESKHDFFAAGHSGTSVAAAYGLSVAKTLQNDRSHTIAVIGDGSFTGGLVYEALNNAGPSDTHLIVVLNDNEMSISSPVGAMARYLTKIRTHPNYYLFKDEVKDTLEKIPLLGDPAVEAIKTVKKRIKDQMYSSTFFEDLGFNYIGPVDGHNIRELTEAFESAKTFDAPVLLHVKTIKGKGYLPAEDKPSKFHGISSFCIETGGTPTKNGTDFSTEFGKHLCLYAEQDERICAITAAMGLGTGLDCFEKRFPNRYFDVGIAEEFGATFSGGLAKGGMIPVFAVYSTFLQRAYDEIVHDVAMQNQKVVFAVDRAGFVGDDGRSHQGIFDLAYLRSIPNTVIYSPSTYKELGFYLYRALYSDGKVVAVRYPRGGEGYLPEDFTSTYDDFNWLGDENADITLVTFGGLFSEAAKAYDELKEEDISFRILKLNRVWPINPEIYDELTKAKEILFFEEGVQSGGIAEAMGNQLMQHHYHGNYSCFAVENTFVHHAKIPALRSEFHLDAEAMKEEVRKRSNTDEQ